MNIVIVTGMSGAGKSTALSVLEDEGYYCIDNMPIRLVEKFAELAALEENRYQNIVLGMDIRNCDVIQEFETVLDFMKSQKFSYKILYLDASDEVLVKRYKETRRLHPLAKDNRVDKGIKLEREQLEFLKKRADYIIDTSKLLTRELKQELEKIFVGGEKFNNLFVTVLSFGFKYGIPSDADLVFDVRFLPNPYYISELRNLTGNDKPIQDFVMKYEETHEFLKKLTDMVEFLLPKYVNEGKNSLVIAVGCTGGKHRSVTLANELFKNISNSEYGCRVEHRDIDKDSIRKKG